MLKKTLLFSALSLSLLSYSEEVPVITKAAFDLGSGQFKLLVVETQGKQIQITYCEKISTMIGKSLEESLDQSFNESIQTVALKALKDLKARAEKEGATEFKGVATAAFRKAANGKSFLSKLQEETGIDLEIISQQEEAILGFRSVLALYPDLDEESLMFWDIGASSFQIVAKHEGGYGVYEGSLGTSGLPKIFLEEIRNTPYSQNAVVDSITPEECHQFLQILRDKIELPPQWMNQKASQKNLLVVGFGNTFNRVADEVGSLTYQKEQVEKAFYMRVNDKKMDLQILGPVSLVYAIMDKCAIDQITVKKLQGGNALGLLISKDL